MARAFPAALFLLGFTIVLSGVPVSATPFDDLARFREQQRAVSDEWQHTHLNGIGGLRGSSPGVYPFSTLAEISSGHASLNTSRQQQVEIAGVSASSLFGRTPFVQLQEDMVGKFRTWQYDLVQLMRNFFNQTPVLSSLGITFPRGR
jgi:hypothetical protein